MKDENTVDEQHDAPDGLPSIEEILPHRPPMLLLERVFSSTEDQARGRARIPAALVSCGDRKTVGRDPVVPVVLAMEMAAQLAAYHASLPAWRGGAHAKDRGFLVRLTQVECDRPTLVPDAATDVRVELTGHMSRLAMYRVEIGPQGDAFVRGQLNIMSMA